MGETHNTLCIGEICQLLVLIVEKQTVYGCYSLTFTWSVLSRVF